MEIVVRAAGTDAGKAREALKQELGFGRVFADRMFRMSYTESGGWRSPEIVPYGPIPMDPAAMVLHYAQEIFEGQKAYLASDGRIALFRPEANAERLNRSARRMCMPEVPVEVQVRATMDLVSLLRDWIPDAPSALYIRPTMIASEPALGVRSAREFLYYIICSPVGPYFPRGFSPVKVLAEDRFVRAAEGGMGDAKTGGNYAGSLLAQSKALKKGYDQILWLDAKEHRYIEEIGAMNVFFVLNGALVTSNLKGSILPGITRDSLLRLAADEGRKVEERLLSIEELIDGLQSGAVTEAFGSGTAAVITPIGTIGYKGTDYQVADGKPGETARQYYRILTDFQYGKAKDPYGWVRFID